MTTGEVIREYREKAGFSQKSLAKSLHITDKAVSKWERGLSLPDVSLLPKLSLLLDVDVDLLLSKSAEKELWVGFIKNYQVDFSQMIYDKPLVYYLITHFLLLGITTLHFDTSDDNRLYLKNLGLEDFGITLCFDRPKDVNVMAMNHPWFLFGSDLTEQFQGAMLSRRLTQIAPEKRDPIFDFIPSGYLANYYTERKRINRKFKRKSLGRGMICLDLSKSEGRLDAAIFVRLYQTNSGFLIGSIEEVAYKKGLISEEKLMKYKNDRLFESLIINKGEPIVD